jgi:hypothetical protein
MVRNVILVLGSALLRYAVTVAETDTIYGEGKTPALGPRVPPDVAKQLSRNVIDLAGVSTFFKRQAECAALFTEGIEQTAPGKFMLRSPFRENFIGSLGCFWQLGLAHFGGLIWPTPGDVKV